jgi:hypothetical protein
MQRQMRSMRQKVTAGEKQQGAEEDAECFLHYNLNSYAHWVEILFT